MKDKELVPLFVPALGAILINAEDKKECPLSEQEVIDIRDKAAVIMVTSEHAAKMAESRGYLDIDPENCWYDWQMLRRELGRKPDIDPGARFSYIKNDDQEFQQTVIYARKSLPAFREILSNRNGNDIFPLVKALLSEPDCRAYIWLVVSEDRADGFLAKIFELPSSFKQFKVGQEIDIPDTDVQDWMVNDNETLYGGYSLRYNRSKMDATGQEAFDKHIGVKAYA